MAIRMLIHDIFVGPVDQGCPITDIRKLTHGLLDIGKVLLNADVVFIAFEDSVVGPFQQELTSLCSDRLEMS